MKNEIKIGIGIVVLAGVGYYFYNKNKALMSDVSSTNGLNQNISNLDKEKLAKDFAGFAFPFYNKANFGKTPMQGLTQVVDSKGNIVSNLVKKENKTELSLYKSMLAMLNGISDDSDALFTLNEVKKMYSSLDEKNYKPDLDTQIRLEKIQLKYPNALKQIDIGS